MALMTWQLGTFPFLGVPDDAPAAGVRVVIDNDFAGDPDDLYQLVHHVMSPGVEVRGIVASHLRPGDVFCPTKSAEGAERRLRELLDVMALDAGDSIWRGSEEGLASRTAPRDTAAARNIVAEAMRDDPRPLFICCGGGLTDVASAWLLEPRIAERATVIWIGGPEHDGLTSPWPPIGNPEYNLAIDVTAGQVVFNDSDLPLWVVPRNIYRQCLVSDVELRRRVGTQGALGEFLYSALTDVARHTWRQGAGLAETYALGDQPLVLLTALQSIFEPDTSSSAFAVIPAPELDDEGGLVPRPEGRPVRVYTLVDTRLMFEDMFLKLEAFSQWRDG